MKDDTYLEWDLFVLFNYTKTANIIFVYFNKWRDFYICFVLLD